MKNKSTVLFFLVLVLSLHVYPSRAQTSGNQWDTEKAWKWYKSNPWICGFNYIPSNAINYTAMWDKTSFSPETIENELALAEESGFNAVRVVLQFIVWEDDPGYFRNAFSEFLSICRKH